MIIDNLQAFRIIYMLVTPFNETAAFKLGIVDDQGKLLKKMSELKTSEEKEAYNLLVRVVFNIKRLIGKLPGGESKLKNIAAAYFLVKESMDKSHSDEYIVEQYTLLTESNITLVEETVTVLNFIKCYEDAGAGGAPANSTGPAVSTDEPVIKPKKRKKNIHSFTTESHFV